MSVALVRLLLEGQPGTNVTFSLVRPRKAEPDKVTLTRVKQAEEIPALSEQEYENSTILYLKPVVLTKSRVDEVISKLKAAPKNRKVLLDLRDVAAGRRPAGDPAGKRLPGDRDDCDAPGTEVSRADCLRRRRRVHYLGAAGGAGESWDLRRGRADRRRGAR
jgi:hypothetical protein